MPARYRSNIETGSKKTKICETSMKRLILTFFLVIFCYSLFFDKKEEKQSVVDEINHIPKEDLNPLIHIENPDTTHSLINLYVFYY